MQNLRLKIAILESGRRGYQIANELGWHPTKVSQIVIGAYSPSLEEKKQLADALGHSVSEVFTFRNQHLGVV
jgi:transcriptional regulator with XRE-family HTH domain|tara:strand:- start:256 stop:471 length:216 start_codon:yes stop_codon:yes gene_type:complete